MQFSNHKANFCLPLISLMTWFGSPSCFGANLTITFDQEHGSYSYSGQPSAAAGDQIVLSVINTDTTCFDFNGGPTVPKNAAAADTSQFEIKVFHVASTTAYEMHAKKKPGLTDTDCGGSWHQIPERDWSAPVTTLGWSIAFAGGFTVDGLTDRAYTLVNTTQNGTAGYVVNRAKNAEDATRQSLALMIHLYNSKWEQTSSWSWVPVSFGISTGSSTTYLIGTGCRFSDKFYLTTGATLGKRKDLPSNLSVGGFTTNQNALGTLADRSTVSWFVGFSYGFLGSDVQSKITSMFGSGDAPKPASDTSGAGSPGATPSPAPTPQPAPAAKPSTQ
jgi:hypothetical protein